MSKKFRFHLTLPLLLIGLSRPGLTAELRSVDQMLADQQARLGYYIKRQVQEWDIGKDGSRDEMRYSIEYKIASARGWAHVLPVMIPYDWRSEVDDIEIVITQGDDKPRKYDRKNMFDAPAYAGFELYSDLRVLAFQERVSAEKGSMTVSFRYRQSQPVLSRIFFVQQQVPVRQSTVSVKAPDGWQLRYSWSGGETDGAMESGEATLHWQGADLAPLLDEPYAPPAPELVRRLLVSCAPPGNPGPDIWSFASWSDVGRWFRKIYSKQVDSSEEMAGTVAELTNGAGSRLEKIHRIYDYVQSKVRYVAVEIGIGGYQPYPASKTFANKYGDCKDKATLLSAMLKLCGIEALPVLVRISNAGSVEREFPSPFQFNHCIVFVPPSEYLPEDSGAGTADEVPAELREGIYLDATPGRCPFGDLPLADQGTWALVVDDTSGRLARIPTDWVRPNRTVRKTQVTLRANGSAVCSVTECNSGIENQMLRMQLFGKKEAERQEFWSKTLNSQFPRSSYMELTVANEDELDRPLELRSKFTVRKYSQKSGKMLILPASYWKVFTENPLEESTRVSDLVFSHRRSIIDSLLIELPSDYKVATLPETVGDSRPFGEYAFTCSSPSPGLVQVVRTCTFGGPRVSADNFLEVKEFFDSLLAKESEKIVLSRSY